MRPNTVSALPPKRLTKCATRSATMASYSVHFSHGSTSSSSHSAHLSRPHPTRQGGAPCPDPSPGEPRCLRPWRPPITNRPRPALEGTTLKSGCVLDCILYQGPNGFPPLPGTFSHRCGRRETRPPPPLRPTKPCDAVGDDPRDEHNPYLTSVESSNLPRDRTDSDAAVELLSTGMRAHRAGNKELPRMADCTPAQFSTPAPCAPGLCCAAGVSGARRVLTTRLPSREATFQQKVQQCSAAVLVLAGMCARACMQALPAFSPRSFARAVAAVTTHASGGQRRDAHTAGSLAGVVRAFRCGRAATRSPACHTPCGSRRRASSRACRSAADTGEAELADGADGAETEGETEWQHALDNMQRPSTQELHPGLYPSHPQPNPANAAPKLQRRTARMHAGCGAASLCRRPAYSSCTGVWFRRGYGGGGL
jgi:hypothetical protein